MFTFIYCFVTRPLTKHLEQWHLLLLLLSFSFLTDSFLPHLLTYHVFVCRCYFFFFSCIDSTLIFLCPNDFPPKSYTFVIFILCNNSCFYVLSKLIQKVLLYAVFPTGHFFSVVSLSCFPFPKFFHFSSFFPKLFW